MLSAGAMVTANVRLVRPLGEGGMGSVWVGFHEGLGTEVAVKFISAELLKADPNVVARFSREAAAAARIKNPHVVQMLDHGVSAEGIPYIIMELMEGESLGDRLLRCGPIAGAELARILRQVGKALDHAHSLDIVHRDIKPDNIFLQRFHEDEVVKVLDFGIAKQHGIGHYDAATHTSALLGTPAYMSPEQVVAAKDVDNQADLWAMAVVAYEALTERLPFDADTLGGLIVAITTVNFAPVSTHAALPELDRWFARAFDLDADNRFRSARELVDEMERCLTTPMVAPSHNDSHALPSLPATAPLPSQPATAPLPSQPATAPLPSQPMTVDPSLALANPNWQGSGSVPAATANVQHSFPGSASTLHSTAGPPSPSRGIVAGIALTVLIAASAGTVWLMTRPADHGASQVGWETTPTVIATAAAGTTVATPQSASTSSTEPSDPTASNTAPTAVSSASASEYDAGSPKLPKAVATGMGGRSTTRTIAPTVTSTRTRTDTDPFGRKQK